MFNKFMIMFPSCIIMMSKKHIYGSGKNAHPKMQGQT